MNGARYLRSYAADPGLLDAVFPLLDLGFGDLAAHVQALQPFGLHWDQVSTPFIMMKDGRPITHIGVLQLPLIVDGREVLVGGIHAVCTHPDHRRQGYYRAVMEEALAWCDERYETLMLIASVLELYEPFGFQVVPESRFVGSVGQVDRTPNVPNVPELRQLDLHQPDDLRLLHRLLDERAAVSRRLGVVRDRAVFLFNQASKPIWYAPDLDAILCFEVGNATLLLRDVVAEKVPTLQQIVERIAAPIERVEVYFAPDQLGAGLTPEPCVVGGDSFLMVRGEFPPGLTDLMLPPDRPFLVRREGRKPAATICPHRAVPGILSPMAFVFLIAVTGGFGAYGWWRGGRRIGIALAPLLFASILFWLFGPLCYRIDALRHAGLIWPMLIVTLPGFIAGYVLYFMVRKKLPKRPVWWDRVVGASAGVFLALAVVWLGCVGWVMLSVSRGQGYPSGSAAWLARTLNSAIVQWIPVVGTGSDAMMDMVEIAAADEETRRQVLAQMDLENLRELPEMQAVLNDTATYDDVQQAGKGNLAALYRVQKNPLMQQLLETEEMARLLDRDTLAEMAEAIRAASP